MLTFIINLAIAMAIFYNIHNSFKSTIVPLRKYYKHYFISMSMLLAIDVSMSFILYRLPYYQVLKGFLLMWISIPGCTGVHFIYNVYIKNIHKLFQGDIDTVILNFKQYYEEIKNKYREIIENNGSGEVEIGFKEDKKKLENVVESNNEPKEAESYDIESSAVLDK